MDSLILGLRVVVALGAVLGLMWFLQHRLGKGPGRRRADQALTVVSRQSLGQRASVVVVDSAGKRFLLGVTDHTVNVLHSGDIPPEPEEVRVPATNQLGDFARMLAEAGHRGGTRSGYAKERFSSYADGGSATDIVSAAHIGDDTVPGTLADDAGDTPPDTLVSRRSSAQRSSHSRASARPGPGHPPLNGSILHGSILSGSTWKQAAAALRGGRRN